VTNRLVLLDSASMYFRAFFGVPDRFRAADGTPVNAVRGFIDAIARVITEFRPDELVACWDFDWRPAFRVELVPSYKAHRVAADDVAQLAEEIPDDLAVQEPVMAAVLAAVGITRIGATGFEADDVIAQLARDHTGPVDIISGDRDLFQLVNGTGPVRVVYTAKGMNNLQLATDDWLLDKYGVPGHQYADLAILRGDASDGLPGVAGVGEKTAASLVQRFGGVQAIVAAAQDPATSMSPAVRRNILTARDYIAVADPAVRLAHPVPIPPHSAQLPRIPAHPEALVELAERYNLDSPLNRLLHSLSEE
jgi:5'-3' exonuclease